MTPKILIGLTGKAGSGKSTIAQHLVDRHHFARISLADPIRNGIAAMFPIPTNCLIDRDLKEQPHPALCGKSPREAMQTLGTEWGRRMIGDNIWLHVAQHKIDYTRDIETIRGIVVDDIRFENEADWIRNQGGEIWHVYRGENPYEIKSNHESESGIAFLDGADQTVLNSTTVKLLKINIDNYFNKAPGSISAIEEGEQAGLAGLNYTHNPYHRLSEYGMDWEDGLYAITQEDMPRPEHDED